MDIALFALQLLTAVPLRQKMNSAASAQLQHALFLHDAGSRDRVLRFMLSCCAVHARASPAQTTFPVYPGYTAMGRFPAIEEDEPPYRLLCNEYPAAK